MASRADPSGRRLPAETAQRTAARLQAVLEAAVDGVLTIDETGRISAANSAAERIFGYSAEEMLGRNVKTLMPSPYRENHDQYLANYLRSGEKKIIGIGREVVGLRRDGSTFPMDLAVGEAFAGDERLFTGMVRDLTERKRLEEQLIQAQKLEAIGQLAGGIAHDFNNLLAVIQGSGELALGALQGEQRAGRAIQRILEASERGARLTGQLLAFSRRNVTPARTVDLNHEVDGMRDLLGHLISEEIELKFRLAASPSTVEIDPTHLDQIVMNLAVNADSAMAGGGRLKIETQTAELNGDRPADLAGLLRGTYVVLIVEDSGSGIPPEHLPHLFEPFFTTKPAGRGTGLGLATVRSIVSQQRGGIRVQSQVGQGTRFEIYLPHVPRALDAASADPARSIRSSAERILLVEDDHQVREVVTEILEAGGYSVRAEASPDEALLATRTERLDLLITDVVMPGMTGIELAARLRARFPGLRVLFMSGYTDAHLQARGQPESGFELIRKPFSASALTSVVRRVLAQEA